MSKLVVMQFLCLMILFTSHNGAEMISFIWKKWQPLKKTYKRAFFSLNFLFYWNKKSFKLSRQQCSWLQKILCGLTDTLISLVKLSQIITTKSFNLFLEFIDFCHAEIFSIFSVELWDDVADKIDCVTCCMKNDSTKHEQKRMKSNWK